MRLTEHMLCRVQFFMLCLGTQTDEFRFLERIEAYLRKRLTRIAS
jgi:hypothetical protein